MATETVLTHPFLRPTSQTGSAEHRRNAVSRSISTLLVAALHVLFFFFFVLAVHPFDMTTKPIIETILSLPSPGNNQSRRDLDNPQLVIAPPRLLSAPTTVVKPPPFMIEKPDQQGAPTQGDILGVVGRELACSAGSWEHLSAAERRVCGGLPWRGMRLPNGSLVMVPPSQLPRLRDPGDSEFRVTGSQQIQRDLQTGQTPGQGGCPILQNTPCLHPSMPGAGGVNVLGGNN